MPEHEPLDYRLRCHTKRTDLPVDVLRDIGEAYAEIGRLQRERDEARREVCELLCNPPERLVKGICALPEECADIRQWDCFKEDTNGS